MREYHLWLWSCEDQIVPHEVCGFALGLILKTGRVGYWSRPSQECQRVTLVRTMPSLTNFNEGVVSRRKLLYFLNFLAQCSSILASLGKRQLRLNQDVVAPRYQGNQQLLNSICLGEKSPGKPRNIMGQSEIGNYAFPQYLHGTVGSPCLPGQLPPPIDGHTCPVMARYIISTLQR